MLRNRIIAGIAGALALGSSLLIAAPSADAAQALPSAVADRLDRQPAEYTASAAKQRRMMIIQQNMNRQRYGGGYGYGARRGHGYRGGGYGYRGGYRPQGTYRQQWGRTW